MDLAIKVIGFLVLAFAVLFMLTWSGIVACKTVSPYWCEAYDMVVGGPRVLIVHGDAGLGSPEALKQYLQDPHYVGVSAVDIQHIDQLSMRNLTNYKLVIVEHARTLSVDQLQMFWDYVVKYGGRLVWIGDAGVERPSGELANLSDANTEQLLVGNPWMRIKESETEYALVNFDEFLGLRYVDNYCKEVTCQDGKFTPGIIESEPTGNHPLIFGTSPQLNLFITKDRDFAIVKQIPNAANSNIVANLNFGGNIKGLSGYLGKSVPFIATSNIGAGGAERVAYYAYPPEWMFEDSNYFMYLKNMYFGMLGR